MEHEGQHEQDDDVYGGDVPEDAYMESDFDPSADTEAAEDSKSKVCCVKYVPFGICRVDTYNSSSFRGVCSDFVGVLIM